MPNMTTIIDLINRYGFPIISAIGLAYMVYVVWKWVTTEVRPTISEANKTLIDLIDRIRLLDHDIIRLTSKVNTVSELRGKSIERARLEADADDK